MGLFKRSMFLGMAAIAILEGFAQAENTLRGAFADKFLIGTALNVRQVESKDKALQALVRDQFSAVVFQGQGRKDGKSGCFDSTYEGPYI